MAISTKNSANGPCEASATFLYPRFVVALAILVLTSTTAADDCPDHEAEPTGTQVWLSSTSVARLVCPDPASSVNSQYKIRLESNLAGGGYRPVCKGLSLTVMDYEMLATVACRSVGMEYVSHEIGNVVPCPYYYPGDPGTMTFSALNFACDGTEDNIEDCSYDDYTTTLASECEPGTDTAHALNDVVFTCEVTTTTTTTTLGGAYVQGTANRKTETLSNTNDNNKWSTTIIVAVVVGGVAVIIGALGAAVAINRRRNKTGSKEVEVDVDECTETFKESEV